jgi:hypothetical protein
VIRGLVLTAAAVLGAGHASAATFTLSSGEQQAAIRLGERSTTTESFDREWRVSQAGESVTVLTPFHRLVVAARHAAFKDETITPSEVTRVLKRDANRLVLSVQLRGKTEDFARYYAPLLLAGPRDIKPTFVQNERTPPRQEDGVYLARCVYGFPLRDLEGQERVTLRVADADGREVSRFIIDLARMR